LNPSFSMTFQSRDWSVARPRFRESGATVGDDSTQEKRQNGATISSLHLLEKMESKTNRSSISWTKTSKIQYLEIFYSLEKDLWEVASWLLALVFISKTSKFCFRIISFSSLESELTLRSLRVAVPTPRGKTRWRECLRKTDTNHVLWRHAFARKYIMVPYWIKTASHTFENTDWLKQINWLF